MAITDKTRKILWARSGNRCAFCRHELVAEASEHDSDSVVGDECHIIGQKPGAPRAEFWNGKDDLDDLKNLILLCKIHHKLVDDQPRTYPVERLTNLKTSHEVWVDKCLSPDSTKAESAEIIFLHRITSGKELMAIFGHGMAYGFDHDEPQDEKEAELIGGFLQCVQDWADIWADIESGERVKVQFDLTKQIRELETAGLWPFGIQQQRTMRFADEVVNWPVGILKVVRSTNPSITHLGELASVAPQTESNPDSAKNVPFSDDRLAPNF